MTQNPALSALKDLLAELHEDPQDEEHNTVSVTHESEWCLSVSRGGHVTWENLEDSNPRHMTGASDETILRLWEALTRGEIAVVEKERWRPGCE
jgi:IS1 family transposase